MYSVIKVLDPDLGPGFTEKPGFRSAFNKYGSATPGTKNVELEILRFGVLVLGDTVDEGEEEVGEEVEGDEADEQPVSLGARQLRLLQVHGEEYAHDPQDLGRVSCTATTTFIPVFTYDACAHDP